MERKNGEILLCTLIDERILELKKLPTYETIWKEKFPFNISAMASLDVPFGIILGSSKGLIQFLSLEEMSSVNK